MRYFILLLISGFFLLSCNRHTAPERVVEVNNSIQENLSLDYQYTFTEATKQSLLGDINQAILLYRKCIQIDSTQSMPYYQIANILFKSGEEKQALNFARGGYRNNKRNKWLNMLLVDLLRMNNQIDEALNVINLMVLSDPSNPEYLFTQAALYNKAGKPKTALQILTDVENQFGISEQVSLTKYNIYNESDEVVLAERELLSLIENFPNEYRYYGILAEFYSSRNENAKAIDIYNKLLSEDSENIYVLLSAAEHYKKVNQYDKALSYYKSALFSSDINSSEQIRVLIDLFTDEQFFQRKNIELGRIINKLLDETPSNDRLRTLRADFYMRVKNFEGAKNDLIIVLENNTKNYVIWEQLLYILNAQANYALLVNYAEQALNNFPEQPSFYLFKGLAEMQTEQNEKALITFKSGLKYSKENKELHLQFLSLLGDVSRNLGNDKESDQYFDEVLDIDPDNIMVLNNYSYYLSLRREQLPKAERMSRKTIEKEPQNSTFLDTYAWILYEMGNYQKALKFITRAIENGGATNPEILEHYGDILIKVDRKEEAKKIFENAIKHGGDESSIRKKILEL